MYRRVGPSLARGYARAEANVSTVIQWTGGTLAKAMALHLGVDFQRLAHHQPGRPVRQDITGGRIEIEEGSSPAPAGPGLGVSLDESLLERIRQNPVTVIPRHITRLYLPGAHVYHTIGYPNISRQTGSMEGSIRGIRLEVWGEDGSVEWENTYDRLEQSEPCTEGFSNG